MAERSSWGVVGLAALCTAPVLAVQVVMAWFSKIFQKHGEAGLLWCPAHSHRRPSVR